jgi:N-acetylmuramic acid 6-phosphate etherase
MPTTSKWRDLPTEAINRRTLRVDSLPIERAVALMCAEDRRALAAVDQERPRIVRAIGLIVRSLGAGGRLLLVGAGTSGRLGVLEAAEVPPTFGTPPRLVRAAIAGGARAVFKAREGAEDDFADGARQLAGLAVSRRDVVVGISASGVTEFVRGGLVQAGQVGARRVLVTCRPSAGLHRLADVVIAPAVGPEVIAGSTRLKSGTATKLVLNMLTTIAMVRLGKTYGNLMVDLRTGSAKLKDRARRIVTLVADVDSETAARLLERSRGSVKTALVMAKTGDSYSGARRRLRASGGSVRVALREELEAVLRRRKA